MTHPADPMAEAKAWLSDRDVPNWPLTKYQLKVGKRKRVSYYPTKGTTFVDGEEGARTRAGLSAIAHPTPASVSLGRLADITNRTVSSTEARLALAVLTTERKAA